MAKIIKKNFIKSLPIFLIVSLLSLSVAGLVFNFDFEVNKIGNKLGLSLDLPEAEANNDVATTTVTVRNAAPYFTVNPAESPSSASTTPVNVGNSFSFTATADDQEGNNYYLVVCDQNGVTPGSGGAAPSCTNTQFCVSGATAPTAQASCSYQVGAIVAETQNWVAYVCDNHSSEAACVDTSNSGSGDSGSPFHINHAPVFTAVNTTVNNQVPGNDFTFEASVTDGDVVGGADVLSLSVCTTDSWATSTGCAATTLCTGTSTSPNVSCSWTSGVPLADTSYNYFAFVKDDNAMPANGNSKTSTYTVANAQPSVSSVLLNNGSVINLNIKGATEITVFASSTSVTDPNGCSDITSATGTIYWSSASGGANCAADDNDCYNIPAISCTINGASCTGPTDSDVTIQCSADLAYYAIPTNGDGSDGNPNSATDWVASIRAFDEALSYASSSPGVELIASVAIEVSETEIAYGSLIAGNDTGDYNATTTIINAGNSPLDTLLIGEDMVRNGVGPEYIGADEQKFDLINFTYSSGGIALASSSDYTLDTVIRRPTSATAVEDDIYWGINVPVILSGDYTGLNTFTAYLDNNVAGEW